MRPPPDSPPPGIATPTPEMRRFAARWWLGAALAVLLGAPLPVEGQDYQRLTAELFEAPAPELQAGLDLLQAGRPQESLAHFRKLAEAGRPDAAFAAAWLLHGGRGIDPAPDEAEPYYRQAAAAGHPAAQFGLALLLEARQENPRVEEALTWRRKSAEAGFVPAMIALGGAYLSRDQPPAPDAAEAVRWLEKAEATGSLEAVHLLADLFWRGRPDLEIERDPDRARFYYQKAAEGGHLPGQVAYGLLLVEDGAASQVEAGIEWLRGAAAKGSGQAMAVIARLYATGSAGIEKSHVLAVTWLIEAATHGDLASQNELGRRYKEGEGVQADPVAAAAWFARCADAGFPPAQVNLGLMYEEGGGAPQNAALASRYYEMAAAQRHPVGMFLLARLRANGTGTEKDLEGAYLLASQAAERYDPARSLRDELRTRLTPEQLARATLRQAEDAPPGTDKEEEP